MLLLWVVGPLIKGTRLTVIYLHCGWYLVVSQVVFCSHLGQEKSRIRMNFTDDTEEWNTRHLCKNMGKSKSRTVLGKCRLDWWLKKLKANKKQSSHYAAWSEEGKTKDAILCQIVGSSRESSLLSTCFHVRQKSMRERWRWLFIQLPTPGKSRYFSLMLTHGEQGRVFHVKSWYIRLQSVSSEMWAIKITPLVKDVQDQIGALSTHCL